MAENDIYNNEKKYLSFKENYKQFAEKPGISDKKRKYYSVFKNNVDYFKKLFSHFEARDISFVRRNRLIQTMRLIMASIDKDLAKCNRDDVNKIVAFAMGRYKSEKTQIDFKKDLKYLWKILFPDLDEKGRPDETIVPYIVRQISTKREKAKEKARKDQFGESPKEIYDVFNKLVSSFSKDVRMQAFLMLAWDSLARPQELLYLRKKDVLLRDNYADIKLKEHGKEGTKRIQCVDSFSYISKWLNAHPLKENDAFLFVNLGNTNTFKQMTPANVNKMIKHKLKLLKTNINITCYSIKRNAITYLDAIGTAETDIQHRAGWTSTAQLKTYSKKNEDMAFKKRLAEEGVLSEEEAKKYLADKELSKKCAICGHRNPFTNEYCDKCKRPLNREELLKKEDERDSKLENLEKQIMMLKNLIEMQNESKA